MSSPFFARFSAEVFIVVCATPRAIGSGSVITDPLHLTEMRDHQHITCTTSIYQMVTGIGHQTVMATPRYNVFLQSSSPAAAQVQINNKKFKEERRGHFYGI